MRIDTNWKQDITALVASPDPHSLDDLIQWLETKDPCEKYDYADIDRCLVGQWLRHCDVRYHNSCNGHSFVYTRGAGDEDFSDFRGIANNLQGCKKHTFGAALTTARNLRWLKRSK